ncbi:MAG: hypothetical protein JWN86_2026 [Planctomycetota bacterium]|nr:hypothetical protein [Planctomycetota bacterium]
MAKIPYATDEDIALRASADFAILCPRDQKLASGGDGFFDPSDRWTLRSMSVDFLSQGLMPGHVVQLLGPATTFRPPGESMIVENSSGHGVTLRRRGQVPGVGQPPGPASGLMGVEFIVATLTPQIEQASFELDRRLGISGLVAGRHASDLVDVRELRELVVLTVLHRQYMDMSRGCGGAQQDSLAGKAQLIKSELDELLDRTAIHWRSVSDGIGDEPTTRFSSRISR